jgi:hypothetical protein
LFAAALAVVLASPSFVPPVAAAEDGLSPQIAADVNLDQVSGSGFGGPVTVTVTDPGVTPHVAESYAPDRMETEGADGFRLYLDASEQASPWDLRPGNVVEVSGPTARRTLVVADLRITGFDLDANTLTGTSDATNPVCLRATRGQDGADAVATVVRGHWTADYDDAIRPYDLRVLDTAVASQPDADGDLTIARLDVLGPARFAFGPELQQVIGYGWPDGATITLTVDRPTTVSAPDLTLTTTADASRISGTILSTGEGNVTFTLAGGPFLVLPGDVLTMTDGTTTKTQLIPSLQVMPADTDAALLSGATSVPLPTGSFLMVGQDAAWAGGGSRYEVVPAADGTWSQSFASDLGGLGQPGSMAPWATLVDADGDSTGVNAPVPQAFVDPVRDRVWAADFTRGLVTLTVTRDGALLDTLTVNTATVFHGNCGLYDMWPRATTNLERPTMALFDLSGRLDILPGDLLAISGGGTLLEITAELVTVAATNPLTGVVSGTADGPVTLKLDDTCSGSWDSVATPEDGAWTYWFDPTQDADPTEALSPGRVIWVIGPGGTTRVRWVVGPGPVFGGLVGPVDGPPMVNTMKAGQAATVRFSLGGDFGLDIFAPGSPSAARIPPLLATRDPIGKTPRGVEAGLRYDAATGEYAYTWVTSTSWAGTYRRLTFTLADGTLFSADFLLTK